MIHVVGKYTIVPWMVWVLNMIMLPSQNGTCSLLILRLGFPTATLEYVGSYASYNVMAGKKTIPPATYPLKTKKQF